MKIMFLREAKGHYRFGTRRVQINIINENLYVQYDAGHITAKDFLEKYGEAESIKFHRKEVLGIFHRNMKKLKPNVKSTNLKYQKATTFVQPKSKKTKKLTKKLTKDDVDGSSSSILWYWKRKV